MTAPNASELAKARARVLGLCLCLAAVAATAACSRREPPPTDVAWSDFWDRVDRREFVQLDVTDSGELIGRTSAGARFRTRMPAAALDAAAWRSITERAERAGITASHRP